MIEDALKITEIFYSLQGESSFVGLPTVFVRLTGCPLRCGYCDTAYAFKGGEKYTLSEVLSSVKAYQPRFVTVTGGEPLAQPACVPLLKALADCGYRVSLETSGALDISLVDPRITIVMDLKTPSSGECHRNRYDNLASLKVTDEIKFVIANREDFDWAVTQIQNYGLDDKAQLLFSPCHGILCNQSLADWIVADNIPARFQVQLHKYIWNEDRGR